MRNFFEKLREIEGKLKLTCNDIIPADPSDKKAREEAVYIHYIEGIKRSDMGDKLFSFRERALSGNLRPQDYKYLNDVLDTYKEKAKEAVEGKREDAYNRVKRCALLIAQILFVNNSVIEGLTDQIDSAAAEKIQERLSSYIMKCASANNSSLKPEEIKFYAILFILQAAFDKLFVPDEDIIQYEEKSGQYTGEYKITNKYVRATLYLELVNRRVAVASDEERELCYNITTGWGEDIDLKTWNNLNQYYYREESPTTKKKNLFAANYDKMLERMLPQFAYSKVKCAEELLKRGYKKYKKRKLKIVEIGAGSGAFAIDLLMACKRLSINPKKISYLGLEPNKHMRDKSVDNIKQKSGYSRLPAGWKLTEGDLEVFTKYPSDYTNNNKAVIVLCYSAHHCFASSINEFLNSEKVQKLTDCIYMLDVVKEHGWTKPYYMWADCESPENFDNVVQKGIWYSETLWQEPDLPIEGNALTNAWCNLRRLTTWPGKKRRIPMNESYIKLKANEYMFLRHNELKKDRTTLLFVHGLGESGLCFREVFDDTKFDNFNLLVPDMLGYGRSSSAQESGYSFEAQVKRLWQLIEHVQVKRKVPIKELILIGHSLGGDLTTLFCEEYMNEIIVKKYINIEGDITPYELFFSSKAVKASERSDLEGFETWLRENFMNDVFGELADKHGESCQRYYASLSFCRADAFGQNAQELCERNRITQGEKVWSEIGETYIELSKKLDTIFCYGTESLSCDTICFLKEHQLNAKPFKEAGHWLMIDRKDEFYDFLYEFINY
jgi:pimeloyl-ACP methyl ester carboxylesterase